MFDHDVMALTDLLSLTPAPFPSFQYTVNGKKIEIAVKQIVSGSNLTPSGTVANPESLKLYYKYRDIEDVVGTTRPKL